MIPNDERDYLRSEEVQEILGTPPSWLTRWGSLLGLITFVCLVFVGYTIKYPDSVESDIRVTSIDPPRRLVAERDLFIADILVQNEDTIQAGQTIIVFRTGAQYRDVLALEQLLNDVDIATDSALLALNIPADLILGNIQDGVYNFRDRQQDLRLAQSGRSGRTNDDELRRRIKREQNNILDERKQQEKLSRQIELVEQRLIREQNLLNARRSSIDRVRILEEEKLQYERSLQASESAVNKSEYEIGRMRREISNYQAGTRDNSFRASNSLREAYESLRSILEDWKKKNLLISPIDGIVLMDANLRSQQFVLSQTQLAIILPLNPKGIVGRIQLEVQGSGKVQVGQPVIVKFASYPFAEFGAVKGKVIYKGKIPTENNIPIEVGFPEGLRTTTGRTLEATQDMIGEAEIITEEKRVLVWIFERF